MEIGNWNDSALNPQINAYPPEPERWLPSANIGMLIGFPKIKIIMTLIKVAIAWEGKTGKNRKSKESIALLSW